MFGYIQPFNPELRVADLDTYKSVYCGLCRALSRSYGPAARFVLSYDFTFTTMLHIGISGKVPSIESGRCPYKLFAKQPHLGDSPELRFSAGIAALMIYYKVRDDIADEGFLKGILYRLALPFVKRAHRKASALYPEADALIANAMREQRDIEAEGHVGLDKACEPSARALAALFEMMAGNEPMGRIMNRLGYMIGRYVYCCDAIADVDEDRKAGRFNPLLQTGYNPDELRASLYLTQAEALTAYELLEVEHMKPILDNILTLGMRHTTDTVLQGVNSYEQSL